LQTKDISRESHLHLCVRVQNQFMGLDEICTVTLTVTKRISLHSVQTGSEAQPASYPMGTVGSFLRVKRQGREADHSPPSSVEVKEWGELYLHSPNHGVVLS